MFAILRVEDQFSCNKVTSGINRDGQRRNSRGDLEWIHARFEGTSRRGSQMTDQENNSPELVLTTQFLLGC